MLDRPEVLTLLFHPRREYGRFSRDDADLLIPVSGGDRIGARYFLAGTQAPTILFFHGNGEIIADYDDLAPHFVARGMNFFAADYRGYGRSTGMPTVTALLKDAIDIWDFMVRYLDDRGCGGDRFVMGRSLGSAPALEIAAERQKEVRGLILESAFAYTIPLLRFLGVPEEILGLVEEAGLSHIEKIMRVAAPILVIHGESDRIIPYTDGRALYEASASVSKDFLLIAGAGHNDLFLRGFQEYLDAVERLVKQGRPGRQA
ncbi:MAG: alpha/beta fold hydrolase [Deltaproteobacteria bacterium]|nr:alpha/beta fold hydrolase [Deltaproteobacteria bacterium]